MKQVILNNDYNILLGEVDKFHRLKKIHVQFYHKVASPYDKNVLLLPGKYVIYSGDPRIKDMKKKTINTVFELFK